MELKQTQVGLIPENWDVKKISEATIIVTDYVANGSFASLAENVKYLDTENYAVLIRLSDYNNQFSGNFVFIDENSYNFLSKSKLFGGEIIISNVGINVGTVFKCPKLKYKMSLAPNSIMVKFRGNNDFYFHWLRSFKGQSMLKSIVTGSAQPKFNKTNFRDIYVPVPPLDIQNKIAALLNVIDDKIELNNRINNNLEQQAQALFNEKILNNPKQGCIGDYCSIKSGFAFKSSWWQNSGVRVIKIKNIEFSELNLHECSYVSEDKISIAKDFVVKGGDLLIAMTGATIGKFAIVPHVDEILLVNQRVGKFFLGDNPLEKLPFIYCTLKQPEVVSEIINRGQVSAQPNICGKDIMSITCTYPDENIIANFNNICRPYFEKIIMNQYENTRLSALRDTLLPKLMSGEIDVSNVDISALTSTDKLSFRK